MSADVPQKSILGSLLSSLYINDFLRAQNTHTAIYADNSAIYASPWSSEKATKYNIFEII